MSLLAITLSIDLRKVNSLLTWKQFLGQSCLGSGRRSQKRDARELDVNSRSRFSVPEFISYLADSLSGGDGVPGDGIPIVAAT